ncbi:MAG: hypothetical protein ACJ8AW_31600 [Rhodopila sp.]
MFENRDAIAPMMAGPRPRWQALAATAIANGVTDENGNPPTRDAVRKAWQAIERNMNEKEPNRLPQIRANPTHQLPVVETKPVQKPLPAPPVEPAASPIKRRFDIRPATFKDN